MTENWPNVMTDTTSQIQESQRTPNRINAPNYTHIRTAENKEKNCKGSLGLVGGEEGDIITHRTKLKITANFSSETMQTKRQ